MTACALVSPTSNESTLARSARPECRFNKNSQLRGLEKYGRVGTQELNIRRTVILLFSRARTGSITDRAPDALSVCPKSGSKSSNVDTCPKTHSTALVSVRSPNRSPGPIKFYEFLTRKVDDACHVICPSYKRLLNSCARDSHPRCLAVSSVAVPLMTN